MNRLSRIRKTACRGLLAAVVIGLAAAGATWWYLTPQVTVTRGLVYGQRHGRELSLDVIRPAHPNGIGTLVMVSGSWKSNPNKFRPWMVAPFLRQGHTVVAISHLSQPKASVMEIVEDVHRAARFVRKHAKSYGIDPERLAVTGGSSGGHLSLMLATCGGPGDATSADQLERESSAVKAAAVFFPVTDLLNLGSSTENLHDGGPPKSFRKAFGPDGTELTRWKRIGHDLSPIEHINPSMPPIFIAHGDADTLVPLEQSVRFQQRAAALGRDVKLMIRPGKKHGWWTMLWDAHLFASWLTERLGSGSP